MRLTSLTVENVLGAPDGTYSFCGPSGAAGPPVYVEGESGSGRTSMLRAIGALKEAIGPYGPPLLRRNLLRRGAKRGLLAGAWCLNDDEQRFAEFPETEYRYELALGTDDKPCPPDPGVKRLFARSGSTELALGVVELVVGERALEPTFPSIAASPSSTPQHLSLQGDRYGRLIEWVHDHYEHDGRAALAEVVESGLLTADDPVDSLAAFRGAIGNAIPRLRFKRPVRTGPCLSLLFVDRGLNDVPLEELARGERDTVLLTLLMTAPGPTHGVVLLDDADIPHRRELGAWLNGLRELAPTNQIIAACTKAPESAPHALVVRLPRQPDEARS